MQGFVPSLSHVELGQSEPNAFVGLAEQLDFLWVWDSRGLRVLPHLV